ncbi:MAG: carbohydrate ABC transporter permease [Eubacteriales bacterium]|nr:carbohydrate ABC transporter permease [Eubacteriales bacterium]
MIARKNSLSRAVRQSRSDRIFLACNALFLLLILVVVIYPVWYAFIASFSDPLAVSRGELTLLPIGFDLSAYKKVFRYQRVMTGYRNTIVYTLTGTLVNTLMVIITAYPLSRKDLYGRKLLTKLFVFTMYFSGGLIPTYLLVRNIGLYNSMWALILPSCISMYNVIIMRSYFTNSLPYEIQEAAMIDGCANIEMLVKIVLPLSMPVIAVILLYHAVGYWNTYFSALIYLSDADKYPLQMVLRDILISSQISEFMDSSESSESVIQQALLANSLKYALIVVSSVPVIVIYPLLQKYFEKGIMLGAVKG